MQYNIHWLFLSRHCGACSWNIFCLVPKSCARGSRRTHHYVLIVYMIYNLDGNMYHSDTSRPGGKCKKKTIPSRGLESLPSELWNRRSTKLSQLGNFPNVSCLVCSDSRLLKHARRHPPLHMYTTRTIHQTADTRQDTATSRTMMCFVSTLPLKDSDRCSEKQHN